MKTKLAISIVGLVFFTTLCCSNSQTKYSDKQLSSEKLSDKQLIDEKLSDEQIIHLLKTFYTRIITEVVEGRSSHVNRLDSIRQVYCTPALLRSIDFSEGDPFVKSNDADIIWLKTLTVEKDIEQKNWFKISYSDRNTKSKTIVLLRVVKENDSFKIDSIK